MSLINNESNGPVSLHTDNAWVKQIPHCVNDECRSILMNGILYTNNVDVNLFTL